MSAPARLHNHSYRDYLRAAEDSKMRLEYYRGEIFAMAGGTPEHAALCARLTIEIGAQLRGRPSRVHSADLRIRVPSADLSAYPDISVICGEMERDPEDRNTALNPSLLVEVLSLGTEANDRGEKLAAYKQIPALREVLLVATSEMQIELWAREEGGEWRRSVAGEGEQLELPETGCSLAIDEIYRDPLGGSLIAPGEARGE